MLECHEVNEVAVIACQIDIMDCIAVAIAQKMKYSVKDSLS